MRISRKRVQWTSKELWALARRQHGVVTRKQLLAGGLSGDMIQRRLAAGRLHPLWRGVYAVGRPEVSDRGRWMAAVLACGPGARLSHGSAAALWGLLAWDGEIDIVLPGRRTSRRPGPLHPSTVRSRHGRSLRDSRYTGDGSNRHVDRCHHLQAARAGGTGNP